MHPIYLLQNKVGEAFTIVNGLTMYRSSYRIIKHYINLTNNHMCPYFMAAQTIRTWQLKVVDLDQFWNGWLFEKFLRKRVSMDKARRKDLYWFIGSVDNSRSRLRCYNVFFNEWFISTFGRYHLVLKFVLTLMDHK